jgi:hypothetical protein
MPSRRTFIKSSAAIGGALGLAPLSAIASAAEPAPRRPEVGRAKAPLNMLILGGTGFTGPEQVEYAIARGHRVTLFNRNKTRPGVFKGRVAEELVGDLNGDTSALHGKQFDVVIDNPTMFPAWVRNAAKYLAGNTRHYIFISTTSVYRDQSQIGINEQSPTTPMPDGIDPYTLDPAHSGRYYGALKTRAERQSGRGRIGAQLAPGGERHLLDGAGLRNAPVGVARDQIELAFEVQVVPQDLSDSSCGLCCVRSQCDQVGHRQSRRGAAIALDDQFDLSRTLARGRRRWRNRLLGQSQGSRHRGRHHQRTQAADSQSGHSIILIITASLTRVRKRNRARTLDLGRHADTVCQSQAGRRIPRSGTPRRLSSTRAVEHQEHIDKVASHHLSRFADHVCLFFEVFVRYLS